MVAVVVVLITAGLGVGVWVARRPPAGPLPPPAVPWPATGEALVFLCGGVSVQGCGRREITAEQRLTLERTLRGMPEVSAVRFQSRAEALKNFTKVFGHSTEAIGLPPKEVGESDMPESFVMKLTTTTGDFRSKARALPGVSDVYLGGTTFWAGRTDVLVRLCPPTPLEKDERCAGRGAATAAEKDAVYQALHTIDGVGAIYLEDREHAFKDAMWVVSARPPDDRQLFVHIPETFHLVLSAPDAHDRVRRAVGELPGVSTVEKELS